MITTSVNTRAVAEVVAAEVLRVNPPASPFFTLSDAVSVSQSNGTVEVASIEDAEIEESISAEQVQNRLIEEAKDNLTRYPQSSRAITKLGMALLNAGKIDEAAQKLEAAVELNGNDIAALTGLARARLRQGDTERATLVYEQVEGIDPQNVAAKIALAFIALRQKHYLKAMNWMERVVIAKSESNVSALPSCNDSPSTRQAA